MELFKWLAVFLATRLSSPMIENTCMFCVQLRSVMQPFYLCPLNPRARKNRIGTRLYLVQRYKFLLPRMRSGQSSTYRCKICRIASPASCQNPDRPFSFLRQQESGSYSCCLQPRTSEIRVVVIVDHVKVHGANAKSFDGLVLLQQSLITTMRHPYQRTFSHPECGG